ncbi:MAG: protein kinase [Candidatus Methylomirabilis sp.]|nr:protein kinase [Candidatus Methylomirabilis sp.]
MLDEENNAYLADFGIAKDTVRQNGGSDEQLYGSPAYIAPERIRHEPTTPQTDIYSLGIILYELLTGKLPFDAPTHTTLMSKHLHDPMPALQVYSPDLPEEMNAIILQATAKNPKVRYLDALGMAADFRRTLQSVERGALLHHGAGDHGDDRADDGFHTIQLEQDTLILHQALEPENPYKGLRAFDEADAGDFFGREALVDRLVQRMAESGPMVRFLAVVGPSGSGKSSVVKAGLVPALRRGDLPGSTRWFIARMVPGAAPLDEMEAALRG